MATEKDLDLLDDYLSNRLAGEERIVFERRLEVDVALRNELNLQQDLIEGIRVARASELKAMLNQTVIPTTTTTSVATKISLWIAVAIVSGAGLYYLLNRNENPEDILTKDSATEQAIPDQQPDAEQEQDQQSVVTEEQEEAPLESPDNTDLSKEDKPAVSSRKIQPAPVKQPALEPYDPTEDMESDSEKPQMLEELTPSSITSSSIVVETDNSNKKLDFHYQFKDGKLFLLGSFEKDLYEIMEFFSNNKRTVFLYYNSSFYLLDEKQTDPGPLKAITDQTLNQKLREYRNQ